MSQRIVRPGDLVFDRVQPGDLIKSELINAILENLEALNRALAGVGGTGLVTVPNLVGRLFSDARTIITAPTTHMVLGSIFDAFGQSVSALASDAQTRRVISQAPPGGARVASGTALSIVLSVTPSASGPGGEVPSNTPTITSFSPTATPIGEVVTILGTNFSVARDENEVFFDGRQADIPLTATTSSLTVRVPPIDNPPTGTASRAVDVLLRTPNGEATGRTNVLPAPAVQPPAITSVTPADATQGTTLTIIGTRFATSFQNNTVFFEDENHGATPTGGSGTTLTVVVPNNLAADFNVTPGSDRILRIAVRNNDTQRTSAFDTSRAIRFFMPRTIQPN